MPDCTVNSKSWASANSTSSARQISFSRVQTLGSTSAEPVVVAQLLPAGDDVLALAVELEVEIEFPCASGRVAGESDAGAGVAAGVAEHHGLHGHRRAGVVADAVQPPVARGFRRVPGTEDRLVPRRRVAHADRRETAGRPGSDSTPAWPWVSARRSRWSSSRSLSASARSSAAVTSASNGAGGKVGNHLGVALHQTAKTVPGQARIAGQADQALDGCRVQADVQHGFHHPRHRHGGAGTHGHQQRPARCAEAEAGRGFQARRCRLPGSGAAADLAPAGCGGTRRSAARTPGAPAGRPAPSASGSRPCCRTAPAPPLGGAAFGRISARSTIDDVLQHVIAQQQAGMFQCVGRGLEPGADGGEQVQLAEILRVLDGGDGQRPFGVVGADAPAPRRGRSRSGNPRLSARPAARPICVA